MPGPACEKHYRLVVHVAQGRGFLAAAADGDADSHLFCVGSFAGETHQSGLSTSGSGSPAWDCCLEWVVGAAQLKALEAAGSAQCKVTFARADGRRVGWVVCDSKQARLSARHGRKPGWWALGGPFKSRDAPEVLMSCVLLEEAAPPLPAAGLQAAGPPQLPAHNVPAGMAPSAAAGAALPAPSTPAAAAPSAADAALLQQASTLSQGLLADGSQRRFDFSLDLREFQAGRRLPLNLASVVVQLSLPAEFAGLILQSNGRLPPQLAPLRTQPPVDVARGCEVALPGGRTSLQFTAGLMALATLLARNPVMSVEVRHREALAEDSLLGRAHIPLAPLLQESWVDGRAGVFAAAPAAAGGDAKERVQVGTLHLVMSLEEVGPAPAATLNRPASVAPSPRRASPRKPSLLQPPSQAATPRHTAAPFALHNWQLAPPPPAQQLAVPASKQLPAEVPEQREGEGSGAAAQPASGVPADAERQSPSAAVMAGNSSHGGDPAVAGSSEEPAAALGSGPAPRGVPSAHTAEDQLPDAAVPVTLPAAAGAAAVSGSPVNAPADAHAASAVGPFGAPAAVPAAAAPAGAPAAGTELEPPSGLQALAPEIEAAWELEVWKRQEEERWRGELRQGEAERMAVLEAEWRRREKERDTEQAALRQEYAALQAKTQQMLVVAEERERKVLAAEEGVTLRRRELEREHSARVGEAEAAVRRLQMEFEHQLELERLRTQQLQTAARGAEERAAAAECRAAAAERALEAFKEEHSRSAAGVAERELGQARAAQAEAEARAARAGEAKQKYKEQVIRLAQEVSALQRQLAEVVGLRREQLDAELMRVAAQEAALAARREAGELGALRQQLGELQSGGAGPKQAPDALAPAVLPGSGAGGAEVQRLLQEREELLASGAYSREDPLIQQLDRRIQQCAAAATAAAGASLAGVNAAPPPA